VFERYRITVLQPEAPAEQTWVLLPDRESAETQARELARRQKQWRIRVYREEVLTTPLGAGEVVFERGEGSAA